jgi:hypothetical protein
MEGRGEHGSKAIGRMTRWYQRWFRVALWIVEAERAPDPPSRSAARGAGFLRWLLAPESLPQSTGSRPREDVPVLAWLFRRETLPPGSQEGEP